MILIESFIKKATEGGSFHALSDVDSDELSRLSGLAEQFEDNSLKIR